MLVSQIDGKILTSGDMENDGFVARRLEGREGRSRRVAFDELLAGLWEKEG